MTELVANELVDRHELIISNLVIGKHKKTAVLNDRTGRELLTSDEGLHLIDESVYNKLQTASVHATDEMQFPKCLGIACSLSCECRCCVWCAVMC